MNYYYNTTLLILLALVSVFIQSHLININELLINTYSNQLDEISIKAIINSYTRFYPYSYLIAIIMLIIKTSIVSLLLYAGIYWNKVEISYKNTLTIVLNSEYILITGSIISILFISLTNSHPTITDLSTPPFSILALFKLAEVEPWLRYPFSLLNIFEVFYWVALIVQWKKLTGKTYGESFDFIGSTYGLGLLLWVLVVIFFTI